MIRLPLLKYQADLLARGNYTQYFFTIGNAHFTTGNCDLKVRLSLFSLILNTVPSMVVTKAPVWIINVLLDTKSIDTNVFCASHCCASMVC